DSIDCGPETRYYSGGTTAQLTTVPDNAKKVWCIITDDCGHRVATDHNVGFSFNDLVITRQPESIQVPCGSTDRLYFTVETSGSARYFYRWYAQTPGSTDSMDCATIPRYFGGAETEQLICVPDFSKNVWCIITDDCGRRVSTDHSIGFTVPTDCQ
ncbi:MAG: hypothetical protein JW863_03105, partial [Chitinispirillaceae bacterium]|nr:hypothetical protein [Chitinispirillaceae bacterium]